MSLKKKLKRYQKQWEILGENDPLWAVLTDNTKRGSWEKYLNDFFLSGKVEIEGIINYLEEKKISFYRKKALDFGCGVGRLTRFLCKFFNSVIGVDVSHTMLEKAKELNSNLKNCFFYLNTKPDLRDFESESFNFIYSSLVFQHLSPDISLNYIRDFVRLLSPDGVAVFHIPFKSPHRIHRRIFTRLIPRFMKQKHFERQTGIKSLMESHYIPKEKIFAVIQSNDARLIEFIPKVIWKDKVLRTGIYIIKK